MGSLAQGGMSPVETAPFHTAITDVESIAKDLIEGVETLGLQAIELANAAERERVETLRQSDEKIDGLESKAKELAVLAELSQIEAQRTSAEIRQLNDELD